MKKVLILFTIIIAIINIIFLYERDFGKGGFGPTAMFVEIILAGLFLCFLISFLLYDTRFRKMITNIWLVLISIFITYIFVEIVVSYLLVKPLSPQMIPDKYVHHKLLPNTLSYFEQREFNYIQRVNNIGLRGQDIEIQKAPNKYRILMLGDSFTMGKGVEDDQTFSVLLEETLNQQKVMGDDKTIEVINAGVDGYAPILSYILLTKYLEPLNPDMIVLNMDQNDLMGEMVYRKYANYGSNGEIIGVPHGIENYNFSERIRSWTERNLYLTRLMFYYINKLLGYKEFTVNNVVAKANYESLMHTLAEDTVIREEQWKSLFETILKIKIYCDDKTIKFLLIIYPRGHQVNEKEWIPGRYQFIPKNATVSDKSIYIIQKFATDNNIQLLNQFPLFRSYSGKSALYFSYDAHWTTTGHQLMASGIAQYLNENYWNE